MAKTIRLNAPRSVALDKMDADEIEALVTREATRALDQLPKGYRPSGINAVSLASMHTTDKEAGIWAEWTRSCSVPKDRVDDFSNPNPVEQSLPDAEGRLSDGQLQSRLIVQRVKTGAAIARAKGALKPKGS